MTPTELLRATFKSVHNILCENLLNGEEIWDKIKDDLNSQMRDIISLFMVGRE